MAIRDVVKNLFTMSLIIVFLPSIHPRFEGKQPKRKNRGDGEGEPCFFWRAELLARTDILLTKKNASERSERATIGSGTGENALEVTQQCSVNLPFIYPILRRQSSDDRATIVHCRCSVSFNPTTDRGF